MKKMATFYVFDFFVMCEVSIADGTGLFICAFELVLFVGYQRYLLFGHACTSASIFLGGPPPDFCMELMKIHDKSFIKLAPC